MKVMIIEDDAAIRQELKLLLENALYEVVVLQEFQDKDTCRIRCAYYFFNQSDSRFG